MSRKIVAIGGGKVFPGSGEAATLDIDLQILRLSGKAHPKLLFIPTASHDAAGYVADIRKYFWEKLGCIVDTLELYGNRYAAGEIEKKILGTDIVYVGGGNTLRMMRMWRKHSVDILLRKAWENGTVMAGLSAGSICWFEAGHSDSRKGADTAKGFEYMKVRGLGFIEGLHCPHYDVEEYRRPELHKMMAKTSGTAIALENGAALEVVDGKSRIIVSRPGAKAFRVWKEDGSVREEEMEKPEP